MAYTTVTPPLSDQELAAAAGQGDAAAFEELYRRHLPAATGVALAVAGNREDAGDAVAEGFARVLQALPTVRTQTFRAYLLTVTRHAAIDIHRRSRRLTPSDEIEALDILAGDTHRRDARTGDDPAEHTLTDADAVLLRQAFATLPERWRSVLWLLEVERLPAQEVGAALGLTANNVAQIGVRARSRLRERYFQAHLGPHPKPECEFTTRRLGAYLTATLSPRDVTKADAHLRTCGVCRHRRDDLRELGLKMRSVLPVPVGLIPLLRARHRADGSLHQVRVGDAASPRIGTPTIGTPTMAATASGTPTMAATASSVSSLQAPIAVVRTALEVGAAQVTALSGGAPLMQRVVGGAAAALAAIGVSSVAVRTDVVASGRTPGVVAPATAAPSPSPATAPAGPAVGGGTGPSSPVSDAGSGLLGIGLAGVSTPHALTSPPAAGPAMAVVGEGQAGGSTAPPVAAVGPTGAAPDPSIGIVSAAAGLPVAAVPDAAPATLGVTPPGLAPLSSTVPGSSGPGLLPETAPVPTATPLTALPGALSDEPPLTPVENVLPDPGPASAATAGQVVGNSSVASGAVPPADEAVSQSLAPASDTVAPLVDGPASLAPVDAPSTDLASAALDSTDPAPTTAPTALAGAAPVLPTAAPSVTPLVDPLAGAAAQTTGQVAGQAAGAAAAGMAAKPPSSLVPAVGVL